FRERMQPFAVNVRMLSRFSSPSGVRETIAGLRNGTVDIVIGTHKLLSKEVSYKDLGLLIIDEEQRFGVGHKEKIKQLRKNVDALTLTATPIPRTLHMSMIGIRDMSLLSEPPEDRKAVQTYVMEYEPEIVREAIRREVSRGGQVYYVYNRTQDIADIAAKIKEMLPDVTVDYIHGRMAKSEIEDRMLSLIDGETDVLVSTTIIETGIDIPNVNTIIIHDSERYGLAQLYQLRGRVGRSSRQAYAFIMYRKDRLPNEEAQKRLEAIRQFTELGSGVRIAKQDLEIRGAGAVLGEAQSGHMTLVGYDLYVRMLRDAVLAAKGENEEDKEERRGDTVIKVTADAYLPDSYIPDEGAKLELYKRISQIRSAEDSETLQDELIDRFGDIPKPVVSLLSIAVIRAKALRLGISEIQGDANSLRFTFFPDAKIRTEGLPGLIREMSGALRYLPQDPPALLYRTREVKQTAKKPVTELLEDLMDRFRAALLLEESGKEST
ncbi:MAG: transcription-repair coupling factor, partial [Lachnospiraceae bacterium]|nr:transcription-repair coupling factor [Lachnospiraceae bacterium]